MGIGIDGRDGHGLGTTDGLGRAGMRSSFIAQIDWMRRFSPLNGRYDKRSGVWCKRVTFTKFNFNFCESTQRKSKLQLPLKHSSLSVSMQHRAMNIDCIGNAFMFDLRVEGGTLMQVRNK